MARLRRLVFPLVMLASGSFLIWVNTVGTWRSGKAEGAGWLFLLVGVIWFGFALYRVLRPYEVAVGTEVLLNTAAGGHVPELATVLQITGDQLVVYAASGEYTVSRHDLAGVMRKKPQPAA